MHIEQGTSHMEVLSAIRGRLRLQFETAVASDEPFRRVPGVLSCRYNPRIRTLLCEYDPDAISEEKLIVRLGAAYAAQTDAGLLHIKHCEEKGFSMAPSGYLALFFIGLDGALSSDCAVLTPLIQTLRDVAGVKALRDATRGGVNAVAHEFAAASGCGIELHENKLPVNETVRGVCELLGLDALNFANEGKLLIAVAREAAESVLAHLRSHPLGRDAAIIGEVVPRAGVRSIGLYGVKRTLDLPHAEPLPRIC